MPNGVRETRHGHSEHWELTSVETAEKILGHSQPWSGFTLYQIDLRAAVLFTLYSNESFLQSNRSYIDYIFKRKSMSVPNVCVSLVSHLREKGSELSLQRRWTCQVNLLNVHPPREKPGRHVNAMNLHGKLCKQLQPFSVSKRETESVGATFEQMGVSHLSVVFLQSGCTTLFICNSCKFRLQCEVPHSYLCVKAPLAGLGE